MSGVERYRARHKKLARVAIASTGEEKVPMKGAKVHFAGGKFVICKDNGCCALFDKPPMFRILLPLLVYETEPTGGQYTFVEKIPTLNGLLAGRMETLYETVRTVCEGIRLSKPLRYTVVPWVIGEKTYTRLCKAVRPDLWERDLYLYCHNDDFQSIGLKALRSTMYIKHGSKGGIERVRRSAADILSEGERMLGADLDLDEIRDLVAGGQKATAS